MSGPGRATRGADRERGAAEATERLRELVEAGGNKVVLVVDEQAGDRDRFGRLLRHLDVGAQLVVEGWADRVGATLRIPP